MARTVRNPKLDTRSARAKTCPPRREPHWFRIAPGRHIGYRRIGQESGTWIAKLRLRGVGRWTHALGAADDAIDANGATVLTFTQAQEKARVWFVEQELKATAGDDEGEQEDDAPYPVADACRDYIADLRARRGDEPANEANGRLRKHLLPELGERLLETLTETEMRGWRNGMVKEDEEDEEAIRRSRDTANRVLGIAKAAFNMAFNAGKVTDDKAWRRVRPFEDAGAARKIFLSDAQQQKLIDAFEPDLRDLALGGAETGARLAELTRAKVRNLDLERGTLNVRSNKGRRGRVRYRDVFLSSDALALLRRLAAGKRPNDHLFLTAAGTPWTKSLHTRPFAAAVKKAGLDPETCFYSLRHSYISRALKVGVPVASVAAQTGTSIAMIQAHYAKHIPSDMAKYAEKASPKLRAPDAGQKVVALQRPEVAS